MGNAEDIDAYQLSNTHWVAFCTGRNCRLTHLQGAKAKWSATLTLRLTFLGDADAPHSLLEKARLGDRSVEIKLKDVDQWKARTPVLVDDIISSGRTMLEAIRLLRTPRTITESRSVDVRPSDSG